MTVTDNYKEAAKLRGEKRSSDVERRVQEAMVTITAEMKANGGIYPKNGGAVSMNEVARRAGIHATTLHTQKQSELGEQVKFWVVSLKKKEVVGRMRARRTLAERAEDWKARYEALQNSHIKTELDLQQAEAERDEAKSDAEKLRTDNAALLELLEVSGGAKVISLHPRKK